MRLDYLIARLSESIARERVLLRRTARYMLPLLLLPIGFALAQVTRGWLGLVAGGLAAATLLMQIELFLRPTLARGRVTDRDITYYLGLAPDRVPPSLAPAVALLVPGALALAGSMAVFLPALLASKVLSLVHLAATPLLFAERPGHAQGDDRPFIMRGGGVLDDMGGRGRLTGPRTDFVDGFVFVETPGLSGAEHLTSHTINLRIKQVLAFGLLAAARSPERRSPTERHAAGAYAHLRDELSALLARYELRAALDVRWLDGRWSEVWPLILRMSQLKENNTGFIDAAQRLRDRALDELEGLAVEATKGSARAS